MKTVTWHGIEDVRVDNVPDPGIINPRDAILKVTSTAICVSDRFGFRQSAADTVGPGSRPQIFAQVARLHSQRRNRSDFLITHRIPLEKAAGMYRIFQDKEDECIKVVLTP